MWSCCLQVLFQTLHTMWQCWSWTPPISSWPGSSLLLLTRLPSHTTLSMSTTSLVMSWTMLQQIPSWLYPGLQAVWNFTSVLATQQGRGRQAALPIREVSRGMYDCIWLPHIDFIYACTCAHTHTLTYTHTHAHTHASCATHTLPYLHAQTRTGVVT